MLEEEASDVPSGLAAREAHRTYRTASSLKSHLWGFAAEGDCISFGGLMRWELKYRDKDLQIWRLGNWLFYKRVDGRLWVYSRKHETTTARPYSA